MISTPLFLAERSLASKHSARLIRDDGSFFLLHFAFSCRLMWVGPYKQNGGKKSLMFSTFPFFFFFRLPNLHLCICRRLLYPTPRRRPLLIWRRPLSATRQMPRSTLSRATCTSGKSDTAMRSTVTTRSFHQLFACLVQKLWPHVVWNEGFSSYVNTPFCCFLLFVA